MNNRLSSCQHEFRRGHSCQTQLLATTHKWAKPGPCILGPLLFLVYINDLNAGLSSSVRLFADDCAICRVINNKKDCDDLQADLDRLYNWTQLWQLNLNQSKCKVMRITNKRKKFHYTYHLNTAPLKWVDTFRYLQAHMDRPCIGGQNESNTCVEST